MSAEYSVEEVRLQRGRLKSGGYSAADLLHIQRMLTAYAKRIEADESAVPVAWCSLTPNGQIAYFDGKPMIMPGNVGNEHHPDPLFTYSPAQAAQVDALRWLAVSCDPHKLTGAFAVDHARRAFGMCPFKDDPSYAAAKPVAQGEVVFTGLHIDGSPRYERAAHPHSPDAADSGRVTPEMVDWLITYQSRLIVNGLHPEDARLWMKSHEFKDFDYSAIAVDEADAAWNDHFANPDDDGPVDFKLSQAFVDRVTRDESGEPPVIAMGALAAQGQGDAVAWRIDTDDDVERVAKAAGWDNRRYMTPADYAIWCSRMREFVRLAAEHPASPAGVPDVGAYRLWRAIYAASDKAGHPCRVGLAQVIDALESLAAAPSAPEGDGGAG